MIALLFAFLLFWQVGSPSIDHELAGRSGLEKPAQQSGQNFGEDAGGQPAPPIPPPPKDGD